MPDNQRMTALNDQLNDRYVAENAYENVITYPKLITLTTTLRCNYRCWMCYQKHYKGDMDWGVLEKLRHVLPSVKTLQFFGGEPLLYNRLKDLCDLAGKNDCEIELITNGSLLDEERRALLLGNNASQVKISLEASTQPTYESMRGGDLEQVLGNIENLTRERDAQHMKTHVQINFVALERNIRELPDLVARAASIGVDKVLVLYAFAPRQREDIAVETLYFYQELSDECMRRALDVAEREGIDLSLPGLFSGEDSCAGSECGQDPRCHSPWKNCMVDLEGDVRFCCGKTGKPIGNLLRSNFDDLWYGEKITRFRRLVNTPGQPDCCNTCRVQGRNIRDIRFYVRKPQLAERLLRLHAEGKLPEAG